MSAKGPRPPFLPGYARTAVSRPTAWVPSSMALVPRWPGEPSRFGEVGARHLLRPAVGKLSRLHRSTLWYYAERSIFAAMTAAVVAWERLRGRPIHVVYVREVICAGWWAQQTGRPLPVEPFRDIDTDSKDTP